MAFRKSDTGIGVTDESRGITVKMAFGRFDDSGRVSYDYIEDGLAFSFQTEAEKGVPAAGSVGSSEGQPRLMTVATHIIERTIVDGLYEAIGPHALDKVDLDRIKEIIKEAIFVSNIDEGRYLRLVPEFKVDFR